MCQSYVSYKRVLLYQLQDLLLQLRKSRLYLTLYLTYYTIRNICPGNRVGSPTIFIFLNQQLLLLQ